MSMGLLIVKSNADLDREEADRIRQEEEARKAGERVVTSLAAHIKQVWEVAKRHKEPIERQIIRNIHQIAGRYDDEKAEQIRSQGLPLIYMQITSVKCRAAKSWVRDVLMPAGDRPWSLTPTKAPSLPTDIDDQIKQRVMHDAMQFTMETGQELPVERLQEVYQELKKQAKQAMDEEADLKAERMSDVIEDQLTEGNWDKAFNEVLSDVIDFPAGILKGPVLRKRKKLVWNKATQQLGVGFEIVNEVERVDPLNFYPSPGITDPNDGDCIEVHDYSLDQIHDLIGLPGYDEDAIRQVLRDYRAGTGISNWSRDNVRTQLYRARGHTSTSSSEEKTIESLEFWGSVQGRMLIEWGKTADEIQDPDAMYDIMAEMIGSHVICVRMNPNPLGDKCYSKASYEDIPGSFWGYGVPDLIKDCQDVCNASARSLVANMGISSGPQVAVNTASLPAGTAVDQMYPWKIWQLDFSKTQSSRPPIEFFQPNSNTNELMAVFKEFSSLADEYSGIPAYSYGVGEAVQGAGRTASGLSMLMNAASKGIKNVVKHIDVGIIATTIERYYVFNMLWHHDNDIKGDAQVIARGAMSLVAKEQNQMRLQEILAQTANPLDMQIIGIEGRAELLRKSLHGVDIGADFIPSDEKLAQRLATQQPMLPQQGAQ